MQKHFNGEEICLVLKDGTFLQNCQLRPLRCEDAFTIANICSRISIYIKNMNIYIYILEIKMILLEDINSMQRYKNCNYYCNNKNNEIDIKM